MTRTLCLILTLLACSSPALAQIPNVHALASCVRSQTILKCADARGNYYAVARLGNTLSTSGFDARSGQHWSQTTSQYGSFAFFSGVTHGGLVWVGSNRKLGWNLGTRVSTSQGDSLRFVCNRLTGCQ